MLPLIHPRSLQLAATTGRSATRSSRLTHRAFTVGLFLSLGVFCVTGVGSIAAGEHLTPFQRAVSTPKGQLKNPYEDPESVAKEGYKIYLSHDCGSCHGGGGGGGMAVPLTNPVWIYGDDDDTLFRVIALGTGSLSPGDAFGKQGYTRKGSEAVVGPMPPFGEIIKSDNDLWKIIAWIRSINRTGNYAR
jgi:mono/diheme cytochrome c family protein